MVNILIHEHGKDLQDRVPRWLVLGPCRSPQGNELFLGSHKTVQQPGMNTEQDNGNQGTPYNLPLLAMPQADLICNGLDKQVSKLDSLRILLASMETQDAPGVPCGSSD